MSNLKNNAQAGFSDPIALPQSEDQLREWQRDNYAWWESHPMRYDWTKKLGKGEFSREFYEEIDRRFFSNAAEYLPRTKVPFDTLAHFSSLAGKDVLEIGVGNGSHAQLLASHARSFTGIDLTDYAVKSTSERLRVFGIPSAVKKMDAEHLAFPDESFDFVWSWGVIHHSSNTKRILEEISRVLRPGGQALIMVYYRGWWDYYVNEFLYGIFSGNLFKTKSLHKSVQMHTDGALARYYTFAEWRALAGDYFKVDELGTLGPKTDVLPLPGGRVKNMIMKFFPNTLNRLCASRLRMGSFLVSRLVKV